MQFINIRNIKIWLPVCVYIVCKYTSTVSENLLLVSFRDLLPTASSKVRLIEGGVNNLPDDHSHRAAMDIYELLQSLTEDDLVLALISGMLYFTILFLVFAVIFRGGLNAADVPHISSVDKLSYSLTSQCVYLTNCRS